MRAAPGIRAEGLRMRKSTPQPDEMEMLASVSRSGGDEAGDRLKDHGVQARFRVYIQERIARYDAASVADKAGKADKADALATVVRLLRKLREGVVASGRTDEFAVQVFEDSVKYALLAHDAPQLNAALHGLIPLYRAAGRDPTYAPLLLVYHLVHSPRSEYQRALEAMTAPPRPLRVASEDADELSLAGLSLDPSTRPTAHSRAITCPSATPISPSALRFATEAARALAEETFNPLAYYALTAGDGLEPALLAWAAPSVRERAAARVRRAYVSAPVPWAGRMLNLTAAGVESWAAVQGAEGFKIVNGVVKLR